MVVLWSNELASLSHWRDNTVTFQTYYRPLSNLTFLTVMNYLSNYLYYLNFLPSSSYSHGKAFQFARFQETLRSKNTDFPGSEHSLNALVGRYYACHMCLCLWRSFVHIKKTDEGKCLFGKKYSLLHYNNAPISFVKEYVNLDNILD